MSSNQYKQLFKRLSDKTALTIFLAFLFEIVLFGCSGDIAIDHSGNNGGKAMAVAQATLGTNTQLVGAYATLTSTGTAEWGCLLGGVADGFDGISTSTPKKIAAVTDAQATLLTTQSYLSVAGVNARLRKAAGPGANMFFDLRTTSGTNPSSSSLGTTTHIPMNTSIPNTAAAGNIVSFTFSSNLELGKAANYSLILFADSSAGLDSNDWVSWVVSNDAGPQACTNFPLFLDSADGGGTWLTADNLGYKRNYFTLVAQTYNTTGNLSWIVTGYTGATWNMSTFAFSENPGGLTNGTITYDVGAGASSSTPSYSNSGLTLAQVKALANLTGKYFYVRANLAAPAPIAPSSSVFDNARIGDGNILAQ